MNARANRIRLAPVVGIALLTTVMLSSSNARATSTEQCVSSATEADRLRRDSTALRAARDRAMVCASDECPSVIRDDCRAWLATLDESIPSVVLLAEDGAGTPLLDARVEIDGAPHDRPMDGQPIALDIGVHTFVFEYQGRSIERKAVLVARQKNVILRERFDSALRPPAEPAPTSVTARTESVKEAPPATSAMSPVRIAGIVVGVSGIAALGLGTYFGIRAGVQQGRADCPNNRCGSGSDPDALRDAKSAGNLATSFFIAGGVLAAAGAALVILGPDRTAARASSGPRGRQNRIVLTPFALGLGLAVQAF